MAQSAVGCRERAASPPPWRLLRLAVEVAELLHSESTPVKVSRLPTLYEKKFRTSANLQECGCKKWREAVRKMDIFAPKTSTEPPKRRSGAPALELSRPKLLQFLFAPLLQLITLEHSGPDSLTRTRIRILSDVFQSTVEVGIERLYPIFAVRSGDELLKLVDHHFDPAMPASVPPQTQTYHSSVAVDHPFSPVIPAPVPPQTQTRHSSAADGSPQPPYRPLLGTPPVVSQLARAPFAGQGHVRPPPGTGVGTHGLPPPPGAGVGPPGLPPPQLLPSLQCPAEFPSLGASRAPQLVQRAQIGKPTEVQRFPVEGAVLPADIAFRPEMSTQLARVQSIVAPTSSKRTEIMKQLNDRLEVLIDDLSSQDKFVPEQQILYILESDLLRPANQKRSFQIPVKPRDLTIWENYSKLHGRVAELIKIFCLLSPITSLFELEQAILVTEKKESFSELRIGPLAKHPLVQSFFRPHSEVREVPEMTSYKLRKHLADFLSRARGQKQKLDDFLAFLCKQESVESPNHLCVRIGSFPLAISIYYRYRSAERESRNRVHKKIEEEMEMAVQYEVDKMKRKLQYSDDPFKQDVARNEPVLMLTAIFDACMQLFIGIQQAKIGDFIQFITRNKQGRNLFTLAIYRGAYKLDPAAVLASREGTLVEGAMSRSVTEELKSEVSFRQSPGTVLEMCLKHLKKIPYPVDLATLSRVELHTTEDFGAPAFHVLGNGSFLHFIATQPKAVEALGGQCIGSSMESQHIVRTKEKLICFISQLKGKTKDDKEHVSEAIKCHFKVDSVTDLGCGAVEKLLTDEKLSNQASLGITYITPLVFNSLDTGVVPTSVAGSVGSLGHQSSDSAMECLSAAPLLEDLHEWTHWNAIYKPTLGDLSLFLRKLARESRSPIHALELSPGKLVRVNPDSTHSDFARVAKHGDAIATAGHLVSMMVKSSSVRDIPVQLLSSYIESALASMSSQHTEDLLPQLPSAAADFVFQCLQRIPKQLCVYVVKEVFLDPLKRVVNISAVDNLLQCCTTQAQRTLLQAIGITVGIKSWTDDYKAMIKKAGDHSVSEASATTEDRAVLSASVSQTSSAERTSAPSQECSDETPFVDFSGEVEETVELEEVVLITAEALEARQLKCRSIVEAIRRDEFGFGIELDDKQRAYATKQRMREGRGLKRLSLELYSKDTHFVLELIQNADDNSYPDSFSQPACKEVPSLKFVVGTCTITVLNNEMGFMEPNVRALCDVGKSTKGAHRAGYIGQKGIGFKSVFRVSDTPEIHSNGFHIQFDASSDYIGYILPHWIQASPIHDTEKWTTQIVLNIKEDHNTVHLAKKFQDIKPSILLFLHRLRSIIVDDQVSGEERHMVCSDRRKGIVEIRHSDGVDKWLVVSKVLTDAKQYKPEVEATELALAFPLPADLGSMVDVVVPSSKDLDQQQVFAFLPLRSYGFRFIVQGDFELPSSREDVNSDSSWNQWLREEIPSLFFSALERMKGLHGISVRQAVALFLQFVPLEGEIHDFFKPVSSRILSLLRRKKCLPSDSASTCSLDEGIQFKQPSQLLFVRNVFIREHIPQVKLESSLQLSYLDSEVLATVNDALQQQLGINGMSIEHLISIAEDTLREYSLRPQLKSSRPVPASFLGLDSDDDDDSTDDDDWSGEEKHFTSSGLSTHAEFVQWIASWLACVHILMEDKPMTSSALARLKQLSIVPLSDGTLTAIEGGSMFFPGDTEKGSLDTSYHELFKELRVVDAGLFQGSDDLVRSRVHKMMDWLGVKNLHPADIVKHHIHPSFASDSWKRKDKRVICTYLVFVKESIGQPGVTESEIIRLFKECIAVVTKHHGMKQPGKETVNFSSEYKCTPDLEALFPGVQWVVVDPLYLKMSKKGVGKSSVESWRIFLAKLGVQSHLAVRRIDQHITEENAQWSDSIGWKRSPDGAYTIKDYCSTEFEAIVRSMESKCPTHQQLSSMKTLAEHLDKEWDTRYRKFTEAECRDGADTNSLGSLPSSFKKSLVQLAWLPQKKVDGSLSPCLFRGMDLYQDEMWIRNLLAHHVPYIGASIKNRHFIDLLCIKLTLLASEVLSFLQQWSTSSVEKDSPFATSVKHMKSVYTYLFSRQDDQETSNQFQECFRSNALIFVPDRYDSSEDCMTAIRPGHFYVIHDVCWMDSTTVIYRKQIKFNDDLPAGIPKLLQPHYHTESGDPVVLAFKYFGISSRPKLSALIAVMEYVCSLSPTPQQQHVEDFSNVAYAISQLARQGPSFPDFVYNQLNDVRVFPTQEGRWVSLKDGLYENDDARLAKLFRTKGIHFLKWPQLSSKGKRFRQAERNDEYQLLYEEFVHICRIRRLSEVIVVQVIPQGVTSPCRDVQQKLHIWVPLLQRYFASHAPQHYAWLQQHSMKDKLAMIQVFSVPGLDCVYSIQCTPEETVTAMTASPGCEYQEGPPPAFYVAQMKPNSLVTAIKDLFMVKVALSSDEFNPSHFERFVKDLWLQLQDPTNKEDEEESLAADYELSPLAEDEAQWCIPLTLEKAVSVEESDSSSSDDDTSMPTEAEKGQQEGLKAWPPKAPSFTDRSKSSPLQRAPGLAATGREDINPDSAIGRKEIELLRQKHSFLAGEREHDRPQPDRQTPPPRMASEGNAPPRLQTQSDNGKRPSTPTESRQLSRTSPNDAAEAPPPEGQRTNSGTGSHLQEPKQRRHTSPWKERSPGDASKPEIVDIRSKMQSVQTDDIEDIEVLSIPDEDDPVSLKAIGRWGERFVYAFILKRGMLADGRVIQGVEWVNERNETDKPYDILVQIQDGPVYIEVKSTASSDKELIAISWNELKFAERESKNFHVYRVYGAGQSSQKLFWLENLYEHLETTPTRFFLEL